MFKRAGMLSPDGRCKTLDSSADGYVRGEGCASAVLQLLTDTAEHSTAVACIMGSAVNQDGRSSSLTAPNGPSQQAVIRQALQASALEPSSIQALQLHGTGGLDSLISLDAETVLQAPCFGTLRYTTLVHVSSFPGACL